MKKWPKLWNPRPDSQLQPVSFAKIVAMVRERATAHLQSPPKMSHTFECRTRVWRARLYQLWQTHLTFIRFKALSIKKRRAWCAWSLQAGISRNLPFGTAPFLLDRWTLLMPQGVCRMDVHWSQCALSVGNTAQYVCVCVCVCVFTFMVCYRARLGQHWDRVDVRDRVSAWNVTELPSASSRTSRSEMCPQIHCCIMGQKALDRVVVGEGARFLSPLYLSLFFLLIRSES